MPEHTDTPKEKILVYIRAEKQKTLHRRQVCINDIASMYCKYSRYEGQIKGMIVDKIRGKKSVISVMKIIEQITESYDDAQVISIGEPEVLVEYDDNSKNKILEALKVAAVCILIFFGSAFTIMAFNNDISISGVFEHFYKQIMGVDKPQVSVLEVFYCIGLAVGIILFFNHIGKRKLSDDVTPISVIRKKIICRVKNSCSGHKRKDTGKQINCHRHRACRSKNARHYRKAQCRDKRWKHNTHIKLNHYIVDDPAKRSCKTAVKQLLFWSGKNNCKR